MKVNSPPHPSSALPQTQKPLWDRHSTSQIERQASCDYYYQMQPVATPGRAPHQKE